MADKGANAYRTDIEGVRAPLGVILYLIRRDNIDIYNIPIARITKEYLDYLDLMEELRIDLAGDFFVMAATLMRIKAQMLLRRDDQGEDDPRQELVRSLLEYKQIVEAARAMKDLEEDRRNIFQRKVPDREKSLREEPVIDLSLYQLMKAFREVILEFEAADVREIELEEFTIEEKVGAVLTSLRQRRQIAFTDMFVDAASRIELIVTLMALLELLKHGQVTARQERSFGPIWIYAGPNFGAPMQGDEETSDGENQVPVTSGHDGEATEQDT